MNATVKAVAAGVGMGLLGGTVAGVGGGVANLATGYWGDSKGINFTTMAAGGALGATLGALNASTKGGRIAGGAAGAVTGAALGGALAVGIPLALLIAACSGGGCFS